MSAGAWVAVAAVVLALGFGLYRAATDGRFRGTHRVRGVPAVVEPAETPQPGSQTMDNLLAGTEWEDRLGGRATLLQFSSAFCAPCRATRRILSDVAGETEGVVHLEVDAEQHLELVRRLGILRTPTTLVLDPTGAEVVRAAGAPSRDQVRAALARC